MKVIFDEFLPLSWSWDAREEEDGREEGGGRQEVDTKDEVAHGRPQVAAVKLLFTVCSAGRNLTSQLVRNNHPEWVTARLYYSCLKTYTWNGRY